MPALQTAASCSMLRSEARPSQPMHAFNPPDSSGKIDRDLGPQPIAGILDELGLDNHALVVASTEPLTHKAVGKARKGRRLSPTLKNRITRALNRAIETRQASAGGSPGSTEAYRLEDLFNY